MQHTGRSFAALMGFALLSACADSPTAPGVVSPGSLSSGLTGGAALSASMTADGFFEQQLEYDWTLDKKVKDILDGNMFPEASLSGTTLLPGQVKWVHYEFTGTRTLAAKHRLTGARGQVCLKNWGDTPTQNLAITNVVQRKSGDQWVEHFSASVPVTANPQLSAGENHCYPYQAEFAAEGGQQFRSAAKVTITNHTGHSGAAYGPGADVSSGTPAPALYAGFGIPTSVAMTSKDAQATIFDGMSLSCGKIFPTLICTGSSGFYPVTLTETTTFIGASTVDFYNYVICGEKLTVTNHAKLVESGPYAPGTEPDTDEASAPIVFDTGDCAPKPANPGCTLTQGYWKNHAWPEHPMWGPSTLATWPDIDNWKFFDTTYEWPEVLNVSPKGDAYFILAHQYIAAILNQQNDAYVPEQVRDALVSAYDYFSLSPEARAVFDRNQLTTWATILDRFNNGQLGTPHCDD